MTVLIGQAFVAVPPHLSVYLSSSAAANFACVLAGPVVPISQPVVAFSFARSTKGSHEPGFRRTSCHGPRAGRLRRDHRQRHPHARDRHRRPNRLRSPRGGRLRDRPSRDHSRRPSPHAFAVGATSRRRAGRRRAAHRRHGPLAAATRPSKPSARCSPSSLPGYGELFRMLSYQRSAPAAMLSRATGGLMRPDRRAHDARLARGGAAGDGKAHRPRAAPPRPRSPPLTSASTSRERR